MNAMLRGFSRVDQSFMKLSHLVGVQRYFFSVRVRFAPSPTGNMHIGGLRTAFFNYLYAKKMNGKFILRVEDTDRQRHVESSVENIFKTLDWIGVVPDESIKHGGEYGPYIQSQRMENYSRIEKLMLKSNIAYPCFCQPQKKASANKNKEKHKKNQKSKDNNQNAEYKKQNTSQSVQIQDQHHQDTHQIYPGTCRSLTMETIKQNIKDGKPYAVRIKSDLMPMPSSFHDEVYGEVGCTPFDDFIIVRRDGVPTFHFANVIDDWQMKITHVMRGQEWLTNTSKHIYLFKVLGQQPPKYAHLPLVVSMAGKKLAKRDPSSSIQGILSKGYQIQAVKSFIGTLGLGTHNEKHEEKGEDSQKKPKAKQNKEAELKEEEKKDDLQSRLLTLPALIQNFDLPLIKKHPVKFNPKHFDHLNKLSLRKRWLSIQMLSGESQAQVAAAKEYFINKVHEYLPISKNADEKYIFRIIGDVWDRLTFISDLKEFSYYFSEPEYTSEASQKDFFKIFGKESVLSVSQTELTVIINDESNYKKAISIFHNISLIFNHLLPPQSYNEVQIAKLISEYLAQSPDIQNQDLYHLLRYLIMGKKSGPSIIKACLTIGRDKTLQRINKLNIKRD